jgi:dTDP-4-amino-4,6-dideoxygalactose transaminase
MATLPEACTKAVTDVSNVSNVSDVVPNIRPYFEFDPSALEVIASLLASGRVSNHGPYVQEFERKLAEYLSVPETVAVANGSDALLLTLVALELGRGQAILPAYTYVATLNAVVQAGLEPVFCDIDPASFTMDPAHLARLLLEHADVRCVIPVNVFGVPPALDALNRSCRRAGTKMIYDNAHGFGTESNGRRVPPEPDAQIFSFHATKALPAVEGGLIVSADAAILSRVKRLRHHGLGSHPAEMIPGFNSKMDELRAVIGLQSLGHFSASLARRRASGLRLLESLHRFPETFVTQAVPPEICSNFQNLGVCCPAAEEVGLARVIALFKEHGVAVRSYFDPPMNRFPRFDRGPALPVTDSVWRTLISMPMHSRMTDQVHERIDHAIAGVARALAAEIG